MEENVRSLAREALELHRSIVAAHPTGLYRVHRAMHWGNHQEREAGRPFNATRWAAFHVAAALPHAAAAQAQVHIQCPLCDRLTAIVSLPT